MGTTRRLRELNPAIRCISMQPDSPFNGLEGLKHMETAIVPAIYDATLADENIEMPTEVAYKMAKSLARHQGLLVGVSAAAAVAASLQVAEREAKADDPVRLGGEVPERTLLAGRMTMLRIGFADYQALRAHGEETFPYECCGVLLGKSSEDGNHVHAIVRAGNTRTDSAHNRYNIAPQELVKIQRQARKLDLDIVGFYHSHPDHPAQWSSTDFAEAHWLGCSYLITSIESGTAAITNSFLLSGTSEDDKKFEDESIEISVSAASDSVDSAKSIEEIQGETA
jgi:proteasome lid subunit RPN8/RPN11